MSRRWTPAEEALLRQSWPTQTRSQLAALLGRTPTAIRNYGAKIGLPPKPKDLEDDLEVQVVGAGLPRPEREVTFHPTRKWRLDLCWKDEGIALEVQGGLGRRDMSHSSIAGIKRDIDKSNALSLMGWLHLKVHADQIDDGTALALVQEAFRLRRRVGA